MSFIFKPREPQEKLLSYRDRPVDERKGKYEELKARRPESIPIICEPSASLYRFNKDLPCIKLLCPPDLQTGQLMFTIRNKLGSMITPTEALLLRTEKGVYPQNTMHMAEAHAKYKASDGFLYLTYDKESTFG